MNIKIYQINMERDPDMAKFMGLARLKAPVDPSSYDEVFSGDVDCKTWRMCLPSSTLTATLCTVDTPCLYLTLCLRRMVHIIVIPSDLRI